MLPLYYGPISRYAFAAANPGARVRYDAPFDKRMKAAHRCEIADTHGRVQLTVPIAKPHGIRDATWEDVAVSPHGRWWHVHRVTLESAYGRTPFFEFYIDRFLPFLTEGVCDNFPTVARLDRAIDAELRQILLLPPEGDEAKGNDLKDFKDLKDLNVPHPTPENVEFTCPPYYQVRAASQGFIAGLSVLDLIFNIGPEAALYIRGK